MYLANLIVFKSKFDYLHITRASSILVFMIIFLLGIAETYELESNILMFDLNKDGLVSGIEVTKESEKASSAIAQDLGIGPKAFFGAIFCIIYYIVINSFFKIINFIQRVIFYART